MSALLNGELTQLLTLYRIWTLFQSPDCSRSLIADRENIEIDWETEKEFLLPITQLWERRQSYNVSLRYITSFNSQKKPVKRHVEDLQSVGIAAGNQKFGTLMNVFSRNVALRMYLFLEFSGLLFANVKWSLERFRKDRKR